MTKQELIDQLLLVKKSNQKLESSNQKLESSNQKLESSNQKLDFVNQKKDQDIAKKEDDIARLNIIVANLQRMLFGSKKERFINENKDQLALSFYHIDNNTIENKIRPVAIGRKNYLFEIGRAHV